MQFKQATGTTLVLEQTDQQVSYFVPLLHHLIELTPSSLVQINRCVSILRRLTVIFNAFRPVMESTLVESKVRRFFRFRAMLSFRLT